MEQEQELSAKEVTKEESKLKELIINFVGETKQLEPGSTVTVGDLVDVFAEQFPDLLMLVAQENFIRGYNQALDDVEAFNKQKVTEVPTIEE